MAPPTCDARQRPSWVVPTPLAPSTVADGGAHAPSPHLPRGRPRGALHCSTTALLATGRWQPARCLIRSVVVPSILACRSMPWRAHEIRFFFGPESERGGWELRRAPWPWRTSCSLAWVARPRSWVWRSCARPSRPRWTSSARASASSSSRRSVPLTPAPPPAPTPPPPLLSGAPRRCVRRTLRGRTHRPASSRSSSMSTTATGSRISCPRSGPMCAPPRPPCATRPPPTGAAAPPVAPR